MKDGNRRNSLDHCPPTRSVIFLDNTAGGLLAERFQEAEVEAGNVRFFRRRQRKEIICRSGTGMMWLDA